MITLFGSRQPHYCDGISRRSFLRIGSLGLGGLTLPRLLQAEAQAGIHRSHKSVILVYLSGAMGQQDSFDLKPEAPAEIRGEFQPIATAVPGIQICEHLPRLARIMDKFLIVRSVVGLDQQHTSHQLLTGYPIGQATGKPLWGSLVSRALGPQGDLVPPYVDLFPVMKFKHYETPPGTPLLGRDAMPLKLTGEAVDVMKLNDITAEHLGERKQLLEALDRSRQLADRAGMDRYYQKAFDVLITGKLMDVLNVDKEPVKVRERYGQGALQLGDGAAQANEKLLLARRLVEAGARFVTVAYGFWDFHGDNFKSMKKCLPLLDQGISALIEDLHERGLDQDVTVLVWGEFGRTPKINKDAGRDHWAPVSSALLAGGGMKPGQVIGSSDSIAAYAKQQPVHFLSIMATVCRNLGIDPHRMIEDIGGRQLPVMPKPAEPISGVY